MDDLITTDPHLARRIALVQRLRVRHNLTETNVPNDVVVDSLDLQTRYTKGDSDARAEVVALVSKYLRELFDDADDPIHANATANVLTRVALIQMGRWESTGVVCWSDLRVDRLATTWRHEQHTLDAEALRLIVRRSPISWYLLENLRDFYALGGDVEKMRSDLYRIVNADVRFVMETFRRSSADTIVLDELWINSATNGGDDA